VKNLKFSSFFSEKINESLIVKKKLNSIALKKSLKNCVEKIHNSILSGGKILLCGNGGSAADAQHLAAEFLVRLKPHINRKSIPALSLALDTSTITACSNDYSFKYLFSRNLDAIGKKNDVLIAISTSGNSQNILEVLKKAKKKEIFSISMLGGTGGKAKKLSNLNLIIPSKNTARIQECHIFLGHIIFEYVENILILKKNLKITSS
jgi:D-sedoheptulose 7-phosphate isomerase